MMIRIAISYSSVYTDDNSQRCDKNALFSKTY